MSVERTREILMAYLERLGKRDRYAEFFTDDVTFELVGSGQEVKGREAVDQFIRVFHETFDAYPKLKTAIVGDDRAALELDFVGTHVADFGGVPASGKPINVPYAVVYDFKADKIAALRLYMPMDVLMGQIGGVPVAEEALA